MDRPSHRTCARRRTRPDGDRGRRGRSHGHGRGARGDGRARADAGALAVLAAVAVRRGRRDGRRVRGEVVGAHGARGRRAAHRRLGDHPAACRRGVPLAGVLADRGHGAARPDPGLPGGAGRRVHGDLAAVVQPLRVEPVRVVGEPEGDVALPRATSPSSPTTPRPTRSRRRTATTRRHGRGS